MRKGSGFFYLHVKFEETTWTNYSVVERVNSSYRGTLFFWFFISYNQSIRGVKERNATGGALWVKGEERRSEGVLMFYTTSVIGVIEFGVISLIVK